MDIMAILLTTPPIILALTVHEFAHAFTANRLGDSTAKEMGRLSLNPMVHLDPIGTIMIVFAHIGWAKPVPFDPANLKNPKIDTLKIALAGPVSNIILAFIFGLIFRLMIQSGFHTYGGITQTIFTLITFSIIINLILCFFNLIPIPPLDGSKILAGMLPNEKEEIYMYYATQYGPMILMGLIIFGYVTGYPLILEILRPFVSIFSLIFAGVDLFGGF